jgi:hypothetical protein
MILGMKKKFNQRKNGGKKWKDLLERGKKWRNTEPALMGVSKFILQFLEKKAKNKAITSSTEIMASKNAYFLRVVVKSGEVLFFSR